MGGPMPEDQIVIKSHEDEAAEIMHGIGLRLSSHLEHGGETSHVVIEHFDVNYFLNGNCRLKCILTRNREAAPQLQATALRRSRPSSRRQEWQ